MRQTHTPTTWVVYRMTLHGTATGGNVVCEQHEWEALEAARPGYHTLLHSGLATEQEAEKLARGTAGDTFRGSRSGKKTPAAPPTA
jgi:hypothetical protein